jgi:hypothetical protein
VQQIRLAAHVGCAIRVRARQDLGELLVVLLLARIEGERQLD